MNIDGANFVSFRTAMQLKEWGYNEPSNYYYPNTVNYHFPRIPKRTEDDTQMTNLEWSWTDSHYITAPTVEQMTKWLVTKLAPELIHSQSNN